MMSEKLKNITKEDWRMLGYYYDRDDENKKWIFIGSKHGLAQFIIQLQKYINNIKNKEKGMHNHWGPYEYLKIMTWDNANITKDCIYGSIEDLSKLSQIIDDKLKICKINDYFSISSDYCSECEYAFEFRIKEYGFDPATEDKQLWKK